jgi:hypothetical protein
MPNSWKRLRFWIGKSIRQIRGNAKWDAISRFVGWTFKHWRDGTLIATASGILSGVGGWMLKLPVSIIITVAFLLWLVAVVAIYKRMLRRVHAALPATLPATAWAGGWRGGEGDHSPVEPPTHHKKELPVEAAKPDPEKERRLNLLGDALSQLTDRRSEIEQQGPEEYEEWLDKNKGQDGWYKMAVDAAKNAVEECFGRHEASYFKTDAGFKRSQNSPHPRYDRAVMNLERYEIEMKKLMERLQ